MASWRILVRAWDNDGSTHPAMTAVARPSPRSCGPLGPCHPRLPGGAILNDMEWPASDI